VAKLKPTILLASTNSWLTPVRIARAFADLGCRVEAVCPSRNALTVSSAVRRTYLYRSFRPFLSMHAAIDSADPDLVVPCDDLATAQLHAIYERESGEGSRGPGTAAMLVRSMGSPASYSITDSRQDFMTLAREEGVLVPESAWIPDLRALDAWVLEKGVPAVLKADCTSGGEGVRVVETRRRARRAFRQLIARRLNTQTFKRILVDGDHSSLAGFLRRDPRLVSIQQYVAGRDANVALACWQGEVLAEITAMVVQARSPKGPAAVIRLFEDPQMSAAVRKIVRRLGLSGFVGFDFVIEGETGKAFLIEINPRATQTCHLELGRGRNLIAALFASLSGVPVARRPGVTARRTIVLWPHAPEQLLPTEVVERAYFDAPRHDPEVVRRYGSGKRFAWSKTLRTLWRTARA
jgi:biotin carboxylase